MGKFFNACAALERGMNACFREEKKLKLKLNRERPPTAWFAARGANRVGGHGAEGASGGDGGGAPPPAPANVAPQAALGSGAAPT